MDKINELIQFADDNDIGLLYRHIPETKSFAIPGCVVMDTDYIYHPGQEKVALAYGIASCYYENFYTEKDSILDRRRAQVKNSKFTYQLVLTHDMIMAAVADGCTEPYSIADHYDLPVRYVAQACFFDQNGYMMPDYLLDEYPDEVPED